MPLVIPRLLCLTALAACLFSVTPSVRAASSFEAVSQAGAMPEVAYSVEAGAGALTIRFKVAEFRKGFPHPVVRLGVASSSTVILDDKNAQVTPASGGWAYTFSLPSASLGADAGKVSFRLAFLVDWVGPEGQSVQRQNFFVPSTWSPYRDIGADSSAWNVFSMSDFLAAQARHSQRIGLTFEQPMNGKASVVIEDSSGRRVRNLVTGQVFAAGPHDIFWDGLDEDGILVPPGEYHWRAISHPGIKPELLMYFYAPGKAPWASHSWLADHSNPTSAAAFGDKVVLGAPVAESGNNIVLADLDGNKLAAANLSSFIGLGRLYLALGPDRIYALNEGSPGYDSVRKDADGKEYVYGDLTLVAWDHAGVQQRYEGKSGEHVVIAYRKPLSEGSGWRKDRLKLTLSNLRGAVYLDGLLYLSLHDDNRLLVLDPKNGRELGGISVPAPGPIATDGRAIYGYSDTGMFRVAKPAVGAAAETLFPVKLSDPLEAKRSNGSSWSVATSLAVNSKGELFLADNGVDQNIKVYSTSGRLLREIGARGGRAPSGPWIADAMRHPSGIAIDARNRLWLAENEEAPKRVSVWDTANGHAVKEIFGPTPYGGTGAGFDPLDAAKWFAAGSVWNLDYTAKTATIKSVLHHQTKANELAGVVDGHNIQTVHQDGRTFLFVKSRYLQVFELLPDGSARLWAVLSALSGFEASSPRWSVPAVLTGIPSLKDELASFTQTIGAFGDLRNNESSSKFSNNYTILWIDRNGDGVAEADEVQVAGAPGQNTGGPKLMIAPWSLVNPTLDLQLPAQNGKQYFRTELKLHGYLPSGAPDWRLDEALADMKPIKDFALSGLGATLTDRQGRLLLNTSPMTGIDPDGSVRWRLRNDWSNVHGSHNAPLPELGVMQGTLGFLGGAPFDKDGDITVLNGNHGRFFALTTDGIYLDEMFNDVRVALERNEMLVGGEAFGGYFNRDAKTGRYLLQAGHGAYRIYELKGMDKLVRSGGDLGVTAEQLTAAQKTNEARVASQRVRKETVLRTVRADVKLSDNPSDWPGAWAAEWGDAKRPFPYVRVKMLRQGGDLVLGYDVKDPSPWMNTGKDQNLLFKTGDVADFEFSTNPAASVTRSDPVPGDRRLLIGDYNGKPVAVLYDYRVPGTTSPVVFNSPWRSAKVDRVGVLADAAITVKKSKTGYVLTVRVPLATLGLPATGGEPLLADFGVIYGDDDGTIDLLRSYWSNPSTGLVNDVPGETMITPGLWGTLRFE